MIDTHAHVHDRGYDDDREAVLARARSAGVERIVTVGCDLDDSGRALDIAETYDLLATIGIHPHEAGGAPADIGRAFDALRSRAPERIVAVGETGLDYYYDHSPHDAQARVLRAQIDYARECGLPVVFHQRDAYDDFIAILREHWDATRQRGVIHCFTGNTAQAQTFVNEFGMRLGIGGVVTFKTAEPLRDAVRAVGLGPLVLETDCPYLAPIPHRGKRNEPAYVADTAATVARLLGRTLEEVESITSQNACALFGLPR